MIQRPQLRQELPVYYARLFIFQNRFNAGDPAILNFQIKKQDHSFIKD